MRQKETRRKKGKAKIIYKSEKKESREKRGSGKKRRERRGKKNRERGREKGQRESESKEERKEKQRKKKREREREEEKEGWIGITFSSIKVSLPSCMACRSFCASSASLEISFWKGGRM